MFVAAVLEGTIKVSATRYVSPTQDGPDFGATFASSQVDSSAARKCFHYA
jgi:hypothetical protein